MSLFSDGLRLNDGHHRQYAAEILGKQLPVRLQAINAKNDDIRKLISSQAAPPPFEFDAYHGTKSAVEKFDLKKAGTSDPGLVGRAVYLTPEAAQASDFAVNPRYGRGDAPNVMPMMGRLEKPYYIDDGVLPDGRRLSELHPNGITKESARAIERELKKGGYDGVVFRLGGEPVQYAVFDPAKSLRSRYSAEREQGK